jgi:hypothetical protein
VVRVAAPCSTLPAVVRVVDDCAGTMVGRAALGISYIELEPQRVAGLRTTLPQAHSAIVLDAPDHVREQLDPWGSLEERALELMRSVKARFDPTRTCNPGVFVGGI